MTQRDKWKKRKCVIDYYAWRDAAGYCVPKNLPPANEVFDVVIHATFPMPKSWSRQKREAMDGGRHRQKPDVDNITKAILDLLWAKDEGIADVRTRKRWGVAGGTRVEVYRGLQPSTDLV